jgi:rubrerythrin
MARISSKTSKGGMIMDKRIGSEDLPEIEYTTYDRLLRAWENSMEMTRDFEMYSKRVEDEEVSKVFKDFAEDEGKHASKLRELLLDQKTEYRS